MASRAQAFNHYHLHSAPSRPRREVWYENDDPVVLPRSRWDFNGALLAAALTAAGVIIASGYAVLYGEPPALAETPSLPLADRWDGDAERLPPAHVLNLLSGPAFAVPSFAAPTSAVEPETDTPITTDDEQHDYTPYPNPSTTPPDAIAPADASPQTPAPGLDPENPYR